MRNPIVALFILLVVAITVVANVAQAQPTQGQLVLSSFSANPGIWYGTIGSKYYLIKNYNSSCMLNCVRTAFSNSGVVCGDSVYRRILQTLSSGGMATLATLPLGYTPTGIELDQDGKHVVTTFNRIYGIEPGSLLTTLANHPGSWNAITRDQDTGDFLLGDYKSGKIVRMDRRTYALTTLTGTYGAITGLAYNPSNGTIALTRADSERGLVIVFKGGLVREIPFSQASCVTVDPRIGSVWAASTDGKIIHTDAAGNVLKMVDVGDHQFTGIDIWADQNISLWGSGRTGSYLKIRLGFPQSPNAPYYCALSFSNRPGIPMTGTSRTLFLRPDPLFFLTLGTSVPELTHCFSGTTDHEGKVLFSLGVSIPSFFPKGMRFFAGAVALNSRLPNDLDISNTDCVKVW